MRGVGVGRRAKLKSHEKFRNGTPVHVLADEYSLSSHTIYQIIEEVYSKHRM